MKGGFSSFAEEELSDILSLDEFLIGNPSATFLVKVSGDSMIHDGIFPGDFVVAERGRSPKNGDIVIVQIEGEWTMKKFSSLAPPKGLSIAAVVTASFRKYR